MCAGCAGPYKWCSRTAMRRSIRGIRPTRRSRLACLFSAVPAGRRSPAQMRRCILSVCRPSIFPAAVPRAFRWATPARQHRARPRHRTQSPDFGQGGFRSRQIGTGAGFELAGGAEAKARVVLHIYFPRSRRCPLRQRPGPRDVPWQDHGNRSGRAKCIARRRINTPRR